MGDVVDMPKKKSKTNDTEIATDLTISKYFEEFSNGFVTIGFNAEGQAHFVVMDLEAADVNWLCDRMKHELMVQNSDMKGTVIDSITDEEMPA